MTYHIKNSLQVIIRLLTVLSIITLQLHGQVKMYWTSYVGDHIIRANLDGTQKEALVTGLNDPSGIALDLNENKLYWTDSQNSRIQRANLDGSEIETLVDELGGSPFGIALDDDKMYWTNYNPQQVSKIQRANLDGSEVEDMITGAELDYLGLIFLDKVSEKMYWTNFFNGAIKKANLDGSNIETIHDNIGFPWGIVLDLPNDKMYWTKAVVHSAISRSNLDCTEVENIITDLSDFPNAIALDTAESKMYWTYFEGDIIVQRANIDGTEIETLSTGLTGSEGLVLDLMVATGVFNNNEGSGTFMLSNNYPNPFQHTTKFEYKLQEKASVQLNIYDIKGKLIRQLVNAVQIPGNYVVEWNKIDLNNQLAPTGVYTYCLKVDQKLKSRKMILID